MKHKLIGLVVGLMVISLACGISSPTAAPQGPGLETVVAGTLQALTPFAPPSQGKVTPTQGAQANGIPVSFQNVSFTIPQGLASGIAGEVVAKVDQASDMPWWEIAPEHIHITLSGYDNSLAKFSVADITIYPAQDYTNAAQNIQKLQALLASPSAPLTKDSVPDWNTNAAPMVVAQMQRISFASGSGVRMLTQYGQAVGPISNDGTFYLFQGLTSDGKYYIVAILPTGAPFLAFDQNATPPQPADGIPFSYNDSVDPNAYEAYFKAVADKINATDANTFEPSLNALDALVQSITVK